MQREVILHIGVHQRALYHAMIDEDGSDEVELKNVALREEMLRYNVITDSEDKYTLARQLAVCKVLVPVFPNEEDADGMPLFGSMYEHDKGIELHVYTSVTLIPDSCDAPDVMFYPFAELLLDIIDKSDVTVLRVDPETDHGVGFLFKDGKPTMFGLRRMEDLMKHRSSEED